MKKYFKFSKYSIVTNIDGINLLGNSLSGVLLKIDDKGLAFANRLQGGCYIDIDTLPEIEIKFMEALDKYDFFSELNRINVRTSYFHITDRCNLNCLGCYSYVDNRNSKQDISLEDAKTVLNNLKDSGLQNLIISGGEPFLHNNIIEILRYAKEDLKIKYITCISNGTAPIEKYKQASKYLDNIAFSLDGYNEETCIIRNKEIFNIIDKKIDELKDEIKLSLIFTVHRKNLTDADKYEEYAKLKGVSYNFSILTVQADCMKNYNGICFEEADFDEMADIFTDYEITDTSLTKQLGLKLSCGAGKTMVSILADGSIMPCHMFFDKKFMLGNALNEKIIGVINNDSNMFKNLNVNCISNCKSCEYKVICGGAVDLGHMHIRIQYMILIFFVKHIKKI